jgi:kinesin family protein C1
MKANDDKLNSIIMELRKTYEALQEKHEKTKNVKLDALDSYNRENEARIAAERLQASFSEDVKRAQSDVASGNQMIHSLNVKCQGSQEYNTSL